MKLAKIKVEEKGEVVEIIGHLFSILQDKIIMVLPEGGRIEVEKDDLVEPLEYLKDDVLVLPNRTEVVKKEKVVGEKKLKPLKEGGMLSKVVDLMKKHPNMKRKEMISLIVETGIMTSLAGASTYHQMAKPYLVDQE